MTDYDELMISLGLAPSGPARPRQAECGTRPGYLRHLSKGEETCAPCRAANRDYQAARLRAPKDPATMPPIEHGTVRGARQHHYRGEPACKPCKDAYNADRTPKRRRYPRTRQKAAA